VATPCRGMTQQPQQSKEGFGTSERPSKAAKDDLMRPAPPVPSAQQEDVGSGARPQGGSFRTASEMCPELKAAAKSSSATKGGGQGGSSSSSAPTFDDVSKSIVGKKFSNEKPSVEKKEGDGSEREWSEEWLRIADKDQLERIVPALEATIHRDSGGQHRITRRDIAGLGFVKAQIEEVLILPQLHPQLFASALTRPARGLLLFGPPGTGKTLLARWIAAECGATFFNVNASSVLSKWIGEAEKTVKALFQLASDRQPSVIFIDEIDSMLSQRRDGDNESSRRVKNEFLTSLEGADTSKDDKVLLVGATNMPWELDAAALRRLPKRLYVPLPGTKARRSLLHRQLTKHNMGRGLGSALTDTDVDTIATRTEGFSGSDLSTLLREAAMGPVREASAAIAQSRRRGGGSPATVEKPRDISMADFETALRMVKPGFSSDEEAKHREFNDEHGTCRGADAMRDVDGDGGDSGDEGGLLAQQHSGPECQ